MKTKVGLVILNYYGMADTIDCLTSLAKAKTDAIDLKVYVVNATDKISQKDPSQGQHIKTKFPWAKVIETDNLGFSGAHNYGTKKALEDGADEIIWLNNDTTVSANFIDALHESLKDSQVGAVTPKIYFSSGREFHLSQYKKTDLGNVIWYAGGVIDWENIYAFHRGVDEVDRGQFDEAEETDFCTGCCFATRKDVFEKVGFFEDKLFLYYEDTDWSVRVQRAGLKTLYQPKSHIWHKNAGSTKGSGSDLQVYYQTRNRFYFAMKYAPVRTKIAIIRESIKKLKKGTQPEKKALRHAITGQYGNRHAK